MKVFKTYCLLLVLLFGAQSVGVQGLSGSDRKELWKEISQYFQPPAEYAEDYGEYRSPLLFYDGTPVKIKADWKKRRTEIKNQWMSMMGEWPSLLTEQELEVLSYKEREDFTQYQVRFYWLPNQQTEGYLLVPNQDGEKYAKNGMKSEMKDVKSQIKDVKLEKGLSEKNPKGKKSALACAAANAWHVLSKLEEVDASRIGIVGHSYGGKWAMFASCLFDKFACAAWIDPGIVFDETKGGNVNYWAPWYLGYYTPPWQEAWSSTGVNAKGLYPKLRMEGYDLHELHALMAPRPFLVSGGSSDPVQRWIPLNHSIAINNFLGYKNRVAMHNRPDHSPNAESNEIVYKFFQYFL